MTDYTKLVEDLRGIEKTMFALGTTHISMDNVSISLAYDKGWGQTANDAAAAIEALQAEIRESMQKCAECGANEPKRGEIVRCGECKWYDPLDRKRPFFCPVMDCATGVMEDDFCSRGERRAKMEVQE